MAGSQGLFQGGHSSEHFAVQPRFPGLRDELQNVVGIETKFGLALGFGKGFLEDERGGFHRLYLIGEDALVEKPDLGVVGPDPVEVAFGCVGEEEESQTLSFQLFDESEETFVGSKNIGGGFEKVPHAERLAGAGAESLVEMGAVDSARFISILNPFFDEELSH